MLLLAIDASTRFSGLAILEDDVVLAEYLSQSRLTHSQRLLPAIDTLLTDINRPVSDVEAIVVSQGPGSFTGLRIGMSLAKGLAQGLQVSIVAIGSLLHWAASLPQYSDDASEYLLPLLDAQRGEFYCALYQRVEGHLIEIVEPAARSWEQLLKALPSLSSQNRVYITGDVIPQHTERLAGLCTPQMILTSPADALPRPSALGLLGLHRLRLGEKDSVLTLAPVYLRLSEAERQRLQREQNAVSSQEQL